MARNGKALIKKKKKKTLNLNQLIKWTDFRLDALLADTMLTKLYATGP
jgi:hypothetical protein